MEQNMKFYDYFLYEGKDEYAQPKLSEEPKGQVKMAIGTASQSIQDSVVYNGTQYTALTHANVSDKMVIRYGDKNLKVLYVNPLGRYKQVYLARM